MKRIYQLALMAVLGIGTVSASFGQQAFADVQDSHWAADAVNRLKIAGFINGYSDGTFKGGNKVSRYEMASMVYAVYGKLVCFNEEVEQKIKEIEAKINNYKAPAAPAAPRPVDTSDIKASIAKLQSDMGGFKAWGNDLRQLKTMGDKYAVELKALGVDMDEFKKSLNSLSLRVKALEDRTEKVRISGDANFFVTAQSPQAGTASVVNQDGRFIQTGPNGAGLDSLRVNHEVGLKIENELGAAIPVKAELVLGNFYSNGANGFGNQGDWASLAGTPYNDQGFAGYLNRLEAQYKPWGATIGRQGLKLSNYILSRIDTNAFYTNERDDNGEFAFDGLRFAIGSGSVTGEIFLGRISTPTTTAGGNVQPINLGFGNILRAQGVSVKAFGDAVASFVQYDNQGGQGANRVEVWGIDGVGFSNDKFSLNAGYGESRVKQGNTTIAGGNNDNRRYNATVGFKLGSVDLTGGFKRVELQYTAPGDWGRLGVERNFTDVEAYEVGLRLALGGRSTLFGRYEDGKGLVFGGDYETYTAGVNFGLSNKWDAGLTYEDTKFNGGFNGKAANSQTKFTTLNLGYSTSESTLFRLFYQYADLNAAYVGSSVIGGQNAIKGGYFGAQYSVKF